MNFKLLINLSMYLFYTFWYLPCWCRLFVVKHVDVSSLIPKSRESRVMRNAWKDCIFLKILFSNLPTALLLPHFKTNWVYFVFLARRTSAKTSYNTSRRCYQITLVLYLRYCAAQFTIISLLRLFWSAINFKVFKFVWLE